MGWVKLDHVPGRAGVGGEPVRVAIERRRGTSSVYVRVRADILGEMYAQKCNVLVGDGENRGSIRFETSEEGLGCWFPRKGGQGDTKRFWYVRLGRIPGIIEEKRVSVAAKYKSAPGLLEVVLPEGWFVDDAAGDGGKSESEPPRPGPRVERAAERAPREAPKVARPEPVRRLPSAPPSAPQPEPPPQPSGVANSGLTRAVEKFTGLYGVEVDVDAQSLKRDGIVVKVSPQLVRLVAGLALLKAPDQVLPKEALAKHIWRPAPDSPAQKLSMIVAAANFMLEKIGLEIMEMRNVGYGLRAKG